jgi:transcriptional regulator NrdR family protein
MRNLLGTDELHCAVQSKTTQLARMQHQFSKLKEKLHHVTEEELLEEGKGKLLLNTMSKLQKKAEILYFSIQRRTRDVTKVAGRLIFAFVNNAFCFRVDY